VIIIDLAETALDEDADPPIFTVHNNGLKIGEDLWKPTK
jgi:hypothetical protein